MTQQEQTQNLFLTITVRTSDGEIHQHNYPITLPLDETAEENIRDLQERVNSSFDGRESVAFENPRVWYRNSHIISIATAIGQMPVDIRRMGFDQAR